MVSCDRASDLVGCAISRSPRQSSPTGRAQPARATGERARLRVNVYYRLCGQLHDGDNVGAADGVRAALRSVAPSVSRILFTKTFRICVWYVDTTSRTLSNAQFTPIDVFWVMRTT